MFQINKVKNAHLAERKKTPAISSERMLDFRDLEERRLPYFSIVPENAATHSGLTQLIPEDKGLFFLLCISVLWPDKGSTVDHAQSIARRLGILTEKWKVLRHKFIEVGLLEVVADGERLMQRELRYQYLDTLDIGKNKVRKTKKDYST